MAMHSPYRVVLTEQDRRVLTQRARAERCPHRDVQRAAIVLAAAEERSNAEIGRRLGVCEDTVRKWRARFCREGLPGLADGPLEAEFGLALDTSRSNRPSTASQRKCWRT